MDDMPFEQFRVLTAFLHKTNKELSEAASNGVSDGFSTNKSERTTFRIVNEE